MAGFRTALGMALSISAAAAVLGACDNGPTAVRAKSAAAAAPAASAGASDERSSFASQGRGPGGGTAGVDHRKDAVKLVEGKPVWSPSRRYSAEENAQRAFERNGETFGASSIDQYVKKAHAFVDIRPQGR